jgi:hypothetical protein
MARPTVFDHYPMGLAAKAPFGPYRAVIDYWHDGDTFYAWVDFGLEKYGWVPVRLWGVNAPEVDSTDLEEKKKGQESLAFASSRWPKGTALVLITFKSSTASVEKKTFTRFVARALTITEDLSDSIIAAGMGEDTTI